jgi:hypothetical protein
MWGKINVHPGALARVFVCLGFRVGSLDSEETSAGLTACRNTRPGAPDPR